MKIKTWRIEEITGYKPQTTFYEDFSIADMFGVNAIKDTYKRAFKHWKKDYIYLTELVLVLNWKIWEHNESNGTYAILYNDLWEATRNYACDTLQDEELEYYFNTTD